MICGYPEEHRLHRSIGEDCPCVVELKRVVLPKWPCLLVVGEPVIKDQAAEIIVRTDRFYFGCNDKVWEKQLHDAANVAYNLRESGYISTNFDSLDKARKRYRILGLDYMVNSQIASSYIGGPHGWCDWEGRIFTDSYNIGKWPSAIAVYSELSEIAKAFPYLEMTVQLLSEESCSETTGTPLVQYYVKEGEVTVDCNPQDLITPPTPLSDSAVISRLTNPYAERGCAIAQFSKALVLAEGK